MYVHDRGLFVTQQLLEAVLSLGKLCEEHGCSYEWVSGQKTRLTKQGKKKCMQNGQFGTSGRSGVVIQQWCKFVFDIVFAGLVIIRSSPQIKVANANQETGARRTQ